MIEIVLNNIKESHLINKSNVKIAVQIESTCTDPISRLIGFVVRSRGLVPLAG